MLFSWQRAWMLVNFVFLSLWCEMKSESVITLRHKEKIKWKKIEKEM